MRKRIVVTGIGAVTPIGIGVDDLWKGVLAEKSAVDTITSFDTSAYNCHIAAEVKDFKPENYLEPKRLKRMDRYSKMAVVAAILALKDAEISEGDFDPERSGVTIGSALGGVGYAEEQIEAFRVGGLRAVSPTLALSVFCGAASCNIGIQFGFKGYNTANADSCASGPIAIGNAMNAIHRGDADVMIAGGVETPLFKMTFGAFALIRAMSTRNDDPKHACRPFDSARDGFLMGEGASLLVLETLEHAQARGAKIYCELKGFGLTNDGNHMTAPLEDGSQAARAMSKALENACVPPHAISYVNAHASSTLLNDVSETKAIKTVFGDYAYKLPISGTKPMHAHSLGAVGAIEAAICALAFKNSWVPPTLNLENPAEGCDLDYIPGAGRSIELEYVLSNSFGFGGINAALVFGHANGLN